MTVRPQTRRLHHRVLLTAFVTVVGCFLAQAATGDDAVPASRVRSSDVSIIALIDTATAQSPTFSLLRMRLEASDGIVYIEPGSCGHGVRACLKMWMQVSGPNRFLRIVVDRQKTSSDAEFMGSIGHELQHALEALSQQSIRDGAQLYNFFRRTAPTDDNRFETAAAVNAGHTVRDELGVRRAAR